MNEAREQEIESIREDVRVAMSSVQGLFPPGTTLTFVARCPGSVWADFLLSDEESIDQIVRSIQLLKVNGVVRK